MCDEKAVLNSIIPIIKDYFEKLKKKQEKKTKIPLAVPAFGWEEVIEAIDSFLSTQITMGGKVKKFEELFAEYIGVRYATMVNSGSSANLLALSILSNPSFSKPLKPETRL